MIEIGKLTRLPLGYVGESNSRTISIDISEWLKEFPGALVMIQVIRPVDRYKYPAAYTMQDGILRWTVDGAELAYAGKGLAQISLYDPDTTREYKSRVVGTVVAESLDGFNEIELEDSDPANKWVNQVLEAANSAEESADRAAESEITVGEKAEQEIQRIRQEGDTQVAHVIAEGEKFIAESPELNELLGEIDNMREATATSVVATDGAKQATNAALAAAIYSAPVIVKEVRGDTAVLVTDSAERPLGNMVAYGKTVQAGSPTPETPVDMVNAGADGSIVVTVSGKNLFDLSALMNHSGTQHETGGNAVRVYTATSGTYRGCRIPAITMYAGVKYVMSADVSNIVSGKPGLGFRDADTMRFIKRAYSTDGKVLLTYTPTETVRMYAILLITDGTESDGDATFANIQLEVGASATPYETYKDGGSVTISTPDGLAGILVTEGGNYVSDAGARYVADYVDFSNRQRVQMVGRIDSYNGEDVGSVWQSSTGELSAGATVIYALAEPVITDLDDETVAAYSTLLAQYPTTCITSNNGAMICFEYVADTMTVIRNEKALCVSPVAAAWEQRMLERIDQCVKTVAALMDVPKAPSGYTLKGQAMTGINYSAVFAEADGRNLVGMQIPLKTYYSALRNPASVMYTRDNYQDHDGKSSFYGINCSGFVSYVIGASRYLTTTVMANIATQQGTPWKVLTVESENDLFKIRRGDILLNTLVSTGDSNHCRIVRDVAYYADTGKLAGFYVSEAWKPFCKTTFFTPEEILAQMYESQPYRVVRIESLGLDDTSHKYIDSNSGQEVTVSYGLDVIPIDYSKSVYPDKGDGGRYAVGEEIQVYIPDENIESIWITNNQTHAVHIFMITSSTIERVAVNGVYVYSIITDFIDSPGTYTIAANTDLDGGCEIIVQ